MKAKFILLLLSISLSSVFTEEDDNQNITIEKASGNLYEYVKLQQIKLTIVSSVNIDPKKLYDLILTHGFKSYITPLNCLKVELKHLSSLVTCDIDVSQLPMGSYLISSFNYTNISYKSTAVIKIKELDKKKVSYIKLYNVISDAEEYSYSYKNRLYFSDNVDPNKLDTLKIEDKDKNEYKILIKCDKLDDKLVKCFGNIKLKAGIYKILYVQYENEIIKPSEDLDFDISEDILDIEEAYNYHYDEICAGRLNALKIKFNKYARGLYLTKVIFRDIKNNKTYEPHFGYIYSPSNGGSDIELMFDFYKIPAGKYYIDFVYKRRLTKTKYILKIDQCEPFDYSELYEN